MGRKNNENNNRQRKLTAEKKDKNKIQKKI